MIVFHARQAAALATVCLLGTSTAAIAQGAAEPPEFFCPAAGYSPVGPSAKLPGLLTAIVPPLRVLDALAHDKLNDLPKRSVAFHAVDANDKPVPGARIAVIHKEHRRFIHDLPGNGPAVSVPHGIYAANAVLPMKDGRMRWGTATVTVNKDGPSTVKIMLTETLPAAVAGEMPRKARAGTTLTPTLSGLSPDFTSLSVLRPAEPGAKSGAAKSGAPEVVIDGAQQLRRPGKPLMVALPGAPGRYEVRLFLCAPKLVLARWPIEVERADIAIEITERVNIATTLQATLHGSLSSAQYVELRNAKGDRAGRANVGDAAEQKIELAVPFEPGRYEFLVITNEDYVTLARRVVTVVAAPLHIGGPERVALGSEVRFDWPRPDDLMIELQLWTQTGNGNPVMQLGKIRPGKFRLVAPPGHHELRLVKRDFNTVRVLARRSLHVDGKAFADVPSTAAPGQALVIRLALTGDFFDAVGIVRRGAPVDVNARLPGVTLSRKTSVTLTAPAESGAYDLVYILGSVGRRQVVERVPLDVN